MSETIKLLELFSGVQSQERALRQLNIPYESVGVGDCDKDVLVSSAAIKSTSSKTFKALYVMSSRFPIGVATRYKTP